MTLVIVTIGISCIIQAVSNAGSKTGLANSAAQNVTKTGQEHHVITRNMEKAIAKNPALQGQLNRSDYIVQAIDQASHSGFQQWHRVYDTTLTQAAKTAESLASFTSQVNNYYKMADMIARFGYYISFP